MNSATNEGRSLGQLIKDEKLLECKTLDEAKDKLMLVKIIPYNHRWMRSGRIKRVVKYVRDKILVILEEHYTKPKSESKSESKSANAEESKIQLI